MSRQTDCASTTEIDACGHLVPLHWLALSIWSRATEWVLDTSGQRILGSYLHATGGGRRDKPRRPFVKAEDPDLDIWRVIDTPDEEADIKVLGRD